MTGTADAFIDDRCPFEAAMAVVRTIAALDPAHPTVEQVVEQVIASEGEPSAGYLLAIARSRHAVFYPQLLRLYAYGRSRVPESLRATFCFRCGQAFSADLFSETLHPLLHVAQSHPAGFAQAIESMVRSYVRRFTGERYLVDAEPHPGGIVFRIRWAHPDAMRQALSASGLGADEGFADSVAFVSGALEGFASRMIDGYAEHAVAWSVSGGSGVIEVPVPREGRFAYDTLIRTLVGHIDEIEAARPRAIEDERLESDLIAGSPSMRRTWELMRRASRSDELVLLRGESGTGKSVLARRIHELSRRRDGPFVDVALTSDIGSDNMVQSDLFGHEKGAFTGAADRKQGLFSLADGGTIFLDEIGDATPELQAKLLRVLESSTFKRLGGLRDLRVDVRVIAATNRDLEKLVREGAFREDLYYRLCVIPIVLPPLRERTADLPALADFLLERARGRNAGPRRRLAAGVVPALAGYPWPGNIRELDHALKYAAAMCDGPEIGLDDFPEPLRTALRGGASVAAPPPSADAAVRVIDAEALRRALRGGPSPSGGRGVRHHDDPRHVDSAKKLWLATLIDEFGGDLAVVARYWDRSSEKTLRTLVRAYGLTEHLAAARVRGPR